MTLDEFKKWLANECDNSEKNIDQSIEEENFGGAAFWQGYCNACNRIWNEFHYTEQKESHKDFSWDNVKVGDNVVTETDIGIVTQLIFNGASYCHGMVVSFSDESYEWVTVYQDNEYKLCNQIGSWMNEFVTWGNE